MGHCWIEKLVGPPDVDGKFWCACYHDINAVLCRQWH